MKNKRKKQDGEHTMTTMTLTQTTYAIESKTSDCGWGADGGDTYLTEAEAKRAMADCEATNDDGLAVTYRVVEVRSWSYTISGSELDAVAALTRTSAPIDLVTPDGPIQPTQIRNLRGGWTGASWVRVVADYQDGPSVGYASLSDLARDHEWPEDAYARRIAGGDGSLLFGIGRLLEERDELRALAKQLAEALRHALDGHLGFLPPGTRFVDSTEKALEAARKAGVLP